MVGQVDERSAVPCMPGFQCGGASDGLLVTADSLSGEQRQVLRLGGPGEDEIVSIVMAPEEDDPNFFLFGHTRGKFAAQCDKSPSLSMQMKCGGWDTFLVIADPWNGANDTPCLKDCVLPSKTLRGVRTPIRQFGGPNDDRAVVMVMSYIKGVVDLRRLLYMFGNTNERNDIYGGRCLTTTVCSGSSNMQLLVADSRTGKILDRLRFGSRGNEVVTAAVADTRLGVYAAGFTDQEYGDCARPTPGWEIPQREGGGSHFQCGGGDVVIAKFRWNSAVKRVQMDWLTVRCAVPCALAVLF